MAGERLGAWVDELTKLRGKNTKSNNSKKEGNLVAKKGEKKLEEESSSSSSTTSCSFQETSTLSESTMCLLLDRFVPC
ncbi:hypothetical protein SOVF_106100 [Spinacia oleracea]|nr:hypothetical protein SOVF_106100 [Spinacia oleracea]